MMRPYLSRLTFALLSLLLLMPLTALAQKPLLNSLEPALAVAVDESVQAEIQRQGVVGVAIGVIRDGKIAYLQGYGHADRERLAPATTETVFNWASNSKPLAALAAMQLVEKNLLDLDADVRQYVPEFPDKGAVIACRHLLCHQSGIPHYSNGKIVPTSRPYPTARPLVDPVVALDVFNQSPLIFLPGQKTSYSSYAYILLSSVVERAGQDGFRAQVEKRIAAPLGMTSLQLDFEADGQPHWAVGYTKNGQGQVVRATEEAHYWKHGAGAFKSNVADFARWAQGLINRRLLSAETEQKMWSLQPLAGGGKTSWGLGFTIEDQGGLKVSHNGKQDETTTRMVLYPRAGHGVVVMCNCGFGDVGAISTAVYRALKST